MPNIIVVSIWKFMAHFHWSTFGSSILNELESQIIPMFQPKMHKSVKNLQMLVGLFMGI